MASWKQDPERIKELRKMQEMIKQAPMIIYFTQQVNPSEPEPVVTPMMEKIEAMIVTSIMMGLEPRVRLASHHPLQKGRNLTGGVWLEDDRMRAVLVMGPPGREEMVTLERNFDASRYGEVMSMMAFKGQQFQSQYQHAVGDVLASIFDPTTSHWRSEDKTKGVHVQVIDDSVPIGNYTITPSPRRVPTLEERERAFARLTEEQQELVTKLSKASNLPVKLYMRWILIYRAGIDDETMRGQIFSNIVAHNTNQSPPVTIEKLAIADYAAKELSNQLMRILPKFKEEAEELGDMPAVFKVEASVESAIAQFGLTSDILCSGVTEEFATHWLLEIVHLSHDENPGEKASALQDEMVADLLKKHTLHNADGTLIAHMLFGLMSHAVMSADQGLRNKWWERRKKIREEYDRNGNLKK